MLILSLRLERLCTKILIFKLFFKEHSFLKDYLNEKWKFEGTFSTAK